MKHKPSFERHSSPFEPEKEANAHTQEHKKQKDEETEDKKPKKDDHPHKNKPHKKEEKHHHKKKKHEKAEPKDTKETKQEKRSEIIERSLHLKKHYEENPLPRDPKVLAQVMVAEHILALHEEAEKPAEPHTAKEKEKLLTAIDSMGELADKLEHPEVESTPELQEAYETVIQLAEHVLAENKPLEPIIEANEAAARTTHLDEHTRSRAPDETPAPQTPTAALISFIVHARNKKIPKVMADQPEPAASFGGSAATPVQQPTIPHVANNRPNAEPHLSPNVSPAEARATYRSNARAEHLAPASMRPPHRLASLAVVSALAANTVHTNSEKPSTPTTTSVEFTKRTSYTPPTFSREASVPTPQTTPSIRPSASFSPPPSMETLHSSAIHEAAPATKHEAAYTSGVSRVTTPPIETSPSRKIEHLPIHTLLSMADSVPVGYGQRLRKVYEKGQIDKDGLIKILKSRSKNLDYIKEYRQQVTKHKHLLESSPEFLHASQNTEPLDSPAPDSAHELAESTPHPEEPNDPASTSPASEKAALSTRTMPTTGVNNPPKPRTPWLVIFGVILLVGATGVLIFFLLEQ